VAATLLVEGVPASPPTTTEPPDVVEALRFVRKCAAACGKEPALARLLFPLVMLGVIRSHAPASEVRGRLSKVIRERVFRDPNAPRRCVQLMLDVLTFLRDQSIYESLRTSGALLNDSAGHSATSPRGHPSMHQRLKFVSDPATASWSAHQQWSS
jgi:hypothetical protein